MEPKINYCILSSIPLSKSFKRYYLSKYKWLYKHNGAKTAGELFGKVRSLLMKYRADKNRVDNLEYYFSEFPFRKNGWMKKLFLYMDTNPYEVLNFFKLYIGLEDPLIEVTQSADVYDSYLKNQNVDTNIPKVLQNFIHFIMNETNKAIWAEKPKTYLGLNLLRSGHSPETIVSKLHYWRSRLRYPTVSSDSEVTKVLKDFEPLPEMYVDVDFSSIPTSTSLELDLWNFVGMQGYIEDSMFPPTSSDPGPGISYQSYHYIYDKLTPDFIHLTDSIINGELSPPSGLSFLSGMYIGHIHHIPKKGTTKRRPIAVPNRFIQYGLSPAYLALSKIVGRIDNDCTYNQNKFDHYITHRVSNDELFVGSVDLSQATDNLPFTWGEYLVEEVILKEPFTKFNGKGPTKKQYPSDIYQSWNLFRECTRARWNNDGIISSWSVGQPLGTLPSFMLLSLTHNAIAEALALDLGLIHSPYRILGDDIIITSSKLYKGYIQFMKNRRIPLSLHKSYKGRLTEFAGKIFIKNHIPRYVSDQLPITWNTLFDYQRSTGIFIPFDVLPRQIKRRVSSHLTALASDKDVRTLYELTAKAEISYRNLRYLGQISDLLPFYYYHLLNKEEGSLKDFLSSMIIPVSGHPVTYLSYRNNDFKRRFRDSKLPDWYTDKFRPNSSDKCLSSMLNAIKEIERTITTNS